MPTDDLTGTSLQADAKRRRWDGGLGVRFGKRRFGGPEAKSGLVFEALEPRILLSADLNPLNSTALTSLATLAYHAPIQSPSQQQPPLAQVSLTSSANTINLDPFVYPSLASANSTDASAQPQGIVSSNPAPPVNGTLAVPGQVDTYTFTLTAAKAVYFDSLTYNGSINWSLSGPSGQIVNQQAFAYSDAQYNNSPVMQLGSGAYTLSVAGSGGAIGNYGFRLLDLSTATPITSGVQVSDALSPSNSTNAYQFAGTAGERLFLNAQSGGTIFWRLVDPFGQVVSNSTSSFGDTQPTLGTSGTYTLLVEGYPYNSTPTQPFSFTLYAPADTTAALTLGQLTKGTVAQPGQLNQFTFTLGAETRALFDSLTANGNVIWSLSGPGGAVVSSRNFTSSDSGNFGGGNDLLDLAAGSYTLIVSANGSTTGSYAFRLLSIAAATPAIYGSTISATLGDAGASGAATPPGVETRLYSFTATAGDQIQLQSASASGGNIYERIFDPYGNLIDGNYLNNLNNGAVQTLLLSGVYTLAIEGYISNSQPANFTLTLTKTGTTTIAAFTGTVLTPGTPVTASFTATNETDDYIFTITGPTRLLFDPLTTTYGTSLSANWQVDGPTGNVLPGQSFFYNQNLFLTVPGTYRLRVINTGAAVQSYSFQLVDLAAATTVSFGATVTDTLNLGQQTKAYSFTAAAGDKIYFDGISNDGYLFWRLVDTFGHDLFNQGYGSVGPYTLGANGTYTLLVGGQYYNSYSHSGATHFSFAIQKDVDTTTALTLGATISSSVARAGQTANYTFTLAAASTLYLDALGQYNSVVWTLIGPSGTVVGATGLDASSNRVLNLSAGTYTFAIYGSGDATPAYAFRLIDLAASATIFNYGDVVYATNTPTQSDGVFRFTAAAADTVFLSTLSNSDNYGLQWLLLDRFGNAVFNKQGFAAVGPLTLTAGGTYTLLVEGYYYDPSTSASYSFRVTPVTTSTQAITIDGPAQIGPFRVPGQIGTALSFTGAENITVPNSSSVNQTGPVTVEFWINPAQYGNPWNPIVYKGDGSNYQTRTYSVWLNSSGFIYLSTVDANGEQHLQSASGSVALGQWTHVAAVFDRVGGSMSIYLNGVLAASDSLRAQPAVSGSYSLSIGGYQEGTQAFNGALDDVRIFSRAVPASEIASNYNNPLTGTEAGLALYLPLNEATGATTLTDASPNAAAVTVATANAGLAGTLTGRIASPGNTNKYTFTLASAAQLLFDGLTDNSNIIVTLTGPNGLSVSRNLRNGDTFEFGSGNPVIQTPAGQYTISVTESGGRTDNYAFRFIKLADAQPIAYNTTVSDTLADGGETRAYSFSATAGARVYLNLLSWTKGAYDADFRLIDPFGNQVYGPAYFQDVSNTVLAYTGTYTLLVEGRTWEPAAGSYSFQLNVVPDQAIPLTLGTNPQPGPIRTTGRFGGGVQMTGTEMISVAENPSLDLTNNVTLQTWIKVDQMPSTWTPILYKGVGDFSNGFNRTYSLWLNANGSILLGTSDASGPLSVQTAGGLVTPGTWVQITGVIDRANGQMHIYVNGVDLADSSVRAQLASASSNPLLIGSTQETDSSYSNFQGTIDEVRIWSIALTASQITANYSAPLAGTPAGLALYLKLDDGAGTAAADSSGNANAATLISANAQGVTGQITAPGQQVHYTFSVASSGQYYFDSLIDNTSFFWSLTGPEGTIVSARNFTSSDANRGNPLLFLASGNYVLTVYGSGATTGFFNFRLLPLTAGQALTPGTPATLTLNPGNGTQVYSFTATAGERVYFDQTSTAGGNVFVRVIDPLGRDLYGAVNYNSLPSFGVQTLAVAGTYFVLVDADVYYNPVRSSIIFLVQPVQDKSATLTLGTAVAGSIDTIGQAAVYTFNVTTATTAFFDSLTNTANLNWTLTGPGGTIVSGRSFQQSDSYDQSNVALALAVGAYTLTVRGNNDSTGAYQFNLLDAMQATLLVANTPATVSLSAQTTKLYRFNGNSGDRVQLLSSVVAGDVTWRLIDPNGNTVFGPQALYSEPLPTTLAFTGQYILAIEGRIYTNSPISATLELIALNVPAINGAVSVSVLANQSMPIDLGYFAAGTYHLSAAGVISLVGGINDPNALLFNPDGTPEVPVTRSGWTYLNPSGSPLNQPDGNIYGPGGSAINLGALMGTLTATPASPADYFTIGYGKAITLATAGHIYAQVNDTYYPDNPAYGFQVTVVPAVVATGATTQNFASAGIPYALSNAGGTPASVVTDASGTFLRLTSAATSSQNNFIDFSSTATGPFDSVQAGFDFRIAPGGTGGLGIGAVLLNQSAWGSSGPGTSYGFIPSVANGLGVKLSVANDGNNNQVALTWNGNTLTQVAAGFNLSAGVWDHASIVVQRTDGGSFVSVILTPNGGSATTIINNFFVGGYFPDTSRLALFGSTDSRTASQDVTNVSVTSAPLSTAVTALTLNTATTGTIAKVGAVELFQFTLATPITAIFDSLTNDGNLVWSLTGLNGTVIGGRNFTQSDSAHLSGSPMLKLGAGLYTLSVYSPNGSYTGSFAFKLDDLASATALTSGTPLTGTLNPGNSSNLYSFSANAGDRFSISGLTGWNGYQYYQVLAPNGQQVVSPVPLYANSGVFTAPLAGTYTLLVEGLYYASSPANYGLTLTQVVDKTATLALNTVTSGSTDVAGQRAIYSFTLAAATQLYFDSLTYDGDFTWTLTGLGGVQYGSQPFNYNDYGAFVAPAGSYTLVVSNPNNDGHTGSFKFRILDLATATTAITVGTPVSGTLDQVSGASAYSFTAAAGSQLYFDETARTNNLNWQLVDAYGTNVFASTNFVPQGFVTLTAGGNYTLLIQGQAYNTGTASFTFNIQPPASTIAALTLGAATSGAIATAGASNAYTFTLGQSTRVVLAALADTLNNSNPYDTSLIYTIVGPGGVVISGSLNRADGTFFGGGAPAQMLAAGSYTLTITDNSDYTGTYSFRLLDLAAANPLTLGTPVSGTLTPGSDTRAYSFTANAGDRIYAQETSYSGGNLIWRLLDPNNNAVFYSNFGSSPGAFTLSVSGTYTLLLEGWVGEASTAASSFGFTIYSSPLSNPIPINGIGGVQAPDLVVTNLAASGGAQIQSGGTLVISWTDSNTGLQPTDAAWTDRVIVRRADNNTILANVTLPYDPGVLGVIAGGAGTARQVSVKLQDGNSGAGALIVSVTTDAGNTVGEQNANGTAFTNNTSTLNISSALAPYPDLQVSGVALSPSAGYKPGDQVTASWTVSNAGSAGVTVPFAEQISIRNTLTNQVIELLSDNVNASAGAPFAAGTSLNRSVTFAWPAGYSSTGNFEIDVTADSTGQVIEAVAFGSRTDNTGNAMVLSAPDIAVTGASITNTAALQSGDTINVVWTDQNIGNAATPVSWTDRVRVVNTATNTVLLDQGLDAGGALGVGMQRARSASFKLPDGTAGVGALVITITANQDTSGNSAVQEATASGNPLANNVVTMNTTSTLRVYPDLKTVVNIPTTGQGGSALTIGWTVTNNGPGATQAGNWVDRIVLSTTPTLGTASDIVLGIFAHTGDLANGAHYAQSQSVTLPAKLQGAFYITVIADFAQAVLEPNTRADATSTALAIAIASPYADLATSAVTVPSVASPGASLLVGWTVTNIGNETTDGASWTDKIYLSQSATVQPGDALIGSLVHFGTLAVGAHYSATQSVTLPGNALGAYHILVQTDAGGTVYQNALTTNDTAASGVLSINSPDLKVTNIVAPATVQPGQLQTVQWTVTDAGAGDALGAWTDRLLFSSDGLFADAITVAEMSHASGLAAGVSYTASTNFYVPSVADSTTARFIVVTDVYHQITEASGGADNKSTSTPVTVTHPDLSVQSVVAAATGHSGDNVTVNWTVANNGSATAAGNWLDQVYIVQGTTLNGTQRYLGSQPQTGPLAAGASYNGTATVQLPVDLAPGMYHILVYANASNQLNEAGNTGNNLAASATITVSQPPLPDLQVSGLTVAPAPTIQSGGNLTVNWNTLNAGTGPVVNSFYSHIVVVNTSTGQTLADAEVYYDAAVNGQIASAASTAQQYVLKLPDGDAGVGSLKFTVTADAFNQVYEGSGPRTDNSASITRSSTLANYPDLMVDGLSVSPAAPVSGGPLTISWNDGNHGSAAVGTSFSDRVTVINQTTGATLYDQSVAYDATNAGGGPIAAGGSAARSVKINLPDGSPGVGQLLVTVTADRFAQVAERVTTGRTDNTATMTLTSSLAAYADLSVTNIVVPANAAAGSMVTVTYTLTNNGTGPANGSWVEQLSLTNDGSAARDVAVLSVSENAQSIAPGASVTRTATFSLPATIDGTQYVSVIADASHSLFQLNAVSHRGVSTATIAITPSLTVRLSASTVAENAGATALTGTVTRSGSTASDLTVTLGASQSGLALPSTVTILAGQAAAVFQAGAANDGLTGPTKHIDVTASASGYVSGTTPIDETDTNTPILTMTTANLTVNRNAPGGAIMVTLTRNTPTDQALTVNLASDLTFFIHPPASATFAIGQSSITVALPLVDDGFVYGNRNVHVTATSAGYSTAALTIALIDTNVPHLTAVLGQTTISEAAGSNATTLTITRDKVTSQPMDISIGARITNIALPPIVTIAANQSSVSVTIAAIDLLLPTSASVLVPILISVADPNYKTPVAGTTIQTALTVTGSVGPNLTVSLGSTTIAGGTTTTGTATRANGDNTSALQVTLTSDNTGEAQVPATVTIAAGAISANFTVTGINDGSLSSTAGITIHASAIGYADGATGLTVSNQNLPDLAVSGVTFPSTIVAGTAGTLGYTVTNGGKHAATGPWTDKVYLSATTILNNDSTLVGTFNQASLAVGASYTNSVAFNAPSTPGKMYVLVVSDTGNVVQNINPGDKQRASDMRIAITPSYTATVAAAVHAAPAGTPILLTGIATSAVSMGPAGLVPVTITITNGTFTRYLTAFSHPDGTFSITFKPVGNEAGDYAITAAQPGATPPAAQDTFSLLGMAASVATISIGGTPNTTVTGTFTLTNQSSVALTGLTASLSGLPATATLTVSPIADIAGKATVTVNYSFVTTAAITGSSTLVLKSHEGATLSLPFNLNVLPLRPNLVANPGFIHTGMVVGTQSQISFDVTNTGGADSGPLTVALPSAPWLSLVSLPTIASIAPGGKTTVVLQLSPDASLPLQEYTGSIVIAGVNSSVSESFTFRAVSTAIGDLAVTAQDESSFFAASKPNLAGATVTLTDPFTSKVVATGVTDATGVAHFTGLTVGGYLMQVSSDHHQSVQTSVQIAPGIETAVSEFLHYQAVTYTWAVVPTAVTDHYKIQLESTFSTAVPMPVVTVDQPLVLPLVLIGKPTVFNLTFTNHGLIEANNLQIQVPSDPDFIITPLVGVIAVLPAMSSITIPISIMINPHSPLVNAASKGLATQSFVDGMTAANGDTPVYTAGYGTAFAKCLGITGVYSYICVNAVWQQVGVSIDAIGCAEDIKGAAGEALAKAAATGNLLGAPCAALDALISCIGAAGGPSNDCIQALIISACGAITGGLAGGPVGAAAGALSAGGSDILACLCSLASGGFGSLGGGGGGGDGGGFGGGGYGGGPGSPYLIPVGYSTPAPPCSPATSSIDAAGAANTPATPSDANSGVCAEVRLRIDQEAVITRTAFAGTLEIDNAETNSLTGISVNLNITTVTSDNGLANSANDGTSANDKFYIGAPTTTNLSGSLGNWTLLASGNGTIKFLFTPTVDAAADAPQSYAIGGTLTYVDNGQTITVPLAKATITVYPEAKLKLDYFWQRDVIGADPFNPTVAVPPEPFYLGLRVVNEGKGNAAKLTITSAQPQIVENQKGLLIDFKIIGSQVENNPGTGSLTVDLGTIVPGQVVTADWALLSSLQGKFKNFSATFTHEDDGGSLRTSLIQSVNIHEMIRVVHLGAAVDHNVPSFLSDDLANPNDNNNQPTTLYIGDGGQAQVSLASNGAWTGGGSAETLTASMAAGWSYLTIADPAPGEKLLSVTRSDGRVIPIDGMVWRTDRTFPDNMPGSYPEFLIHLLDYNSTGSYTFNFVPDDGKPPHITIVQDLSGTVLTTGPASIDVTFSKPIDLTTFTTAALALTDNGAPVTLTGISISDLGGGVYRIGGLAPLTGGNGNYSLTIDGTQISDPAKVLGDNIVTTSFTVSSGAAILTHLSPVTPNLRNTADDTVDVTFSKAINPATFDGRALSLTHNGTAVAITNAVNVVQLTSTTFRIGGLATLTAADGIYALSVDASKVKDTGGVAAAGLLTDTWTVDTTAPVLLSIETITTNPRNIIVPHLDVTLSKAIDPSSFDYHAITVTQNGGQNLVTAATTVTQIDATHYRIANFNNSFSAVTGINGSYTITVNGATLHDLAGNAGTGTVSETWVLNVTGPTAATNLRITPDNGISSTDGLTNTLTLTLLGHVADPTDAVRITDLTTSKELGYATVDGTGAVSLGFTLNSPGAHHIRVRTVDTAGNLADASLDVFIDQTPPMVSAISAVAPNTVTTPVNSLDVTLSKAIDASTFTTSALQLTLGTSVVALDPSVTITSLGGNVWRIAGLSGSDAATGNYSLLVDATKLVDTAGNTGVGTLSQTWTQAGTAATASIGGTVFTDTLGTGARTTTAQDPGIGGWTVFIDTAGTGSFVNGTDPNSITASDGSYSFTGLAAGTYKVLVVPQGGWTATGATSQTITVLAGQTSNTGNDFGEFQLGTLSGTAFDDANANGSQDTGETPIAGLTVFLDLTGDGVLRAGDPQVITGVDGKFSFTGIGPGTVRLGEVVPAGYKLTTPVSPIVVTSGTSQTGLAIGDVKLGSISGLLFNDVTGSGVFQTGDTGLAGWKVYIDTGHLGTLVTSDPQTTTDANGNYSFTGLLPGSYTIGEVLQPGYVEISPLSATATGRSVNIALQDVPVVLDSTPAPAGLGAATLTDAANLTQLTAMKLDPRFAKLTGSGETTVIIDTGLNDISSYFRPGEVVYQYDFADNTSSVVDTLGHGSNIASIIGSNNSQYPGLAPDANLIILKVFDNSGHGYFSYVDEALQWAATNAAAYHIGVVNMSLGDGGNWTHAASHYGMGAALSQLAAENVITVAAAGNSYYYYQTIGLAYPGSDPSVLAVGSVWPGNLGGPWNYSDGSANYTTAADQFAVYSQRDPNLAYALAPGGVFTGAGVGGGSTSEQGTSQASAYMAGAATLAQELAQQVLGRQLNVVEFAHLLSLSGDTVVDSANGASNVTPTGLSYSRLNFVKLFSAIEAMNGVTPTPPTTPAPPASGGSAGSSASASGFATVQVSEGQAVSGVNFSNFLAGSIAGTVFLDTNGDGTRQIAETGLSGITVFLDTAGTGVLTAGDPQTLTDSTGHYSFAGLTAGSYTIREVVPAGDLETTPDPVTVTMTSGLAATENFGLFAAGTISGTVFRDANVNGTLDTGETGIAGRTVFIDKAGTGLVAAGDPQAVTDNSGHYSFTGIGPGTYVVREVVTVDVTETSPDPVAVTMMSGLLSTVNFGLTYKGPTFSATGGSTATIGQTYSIALSATDPLHTIREWYIDWGDGTLQGIVGNPSIATHTYQSGGTSYVIAASVMDDIGLYDASPFSVAVGAPLQVTSVTPNVSGVAVRFNHTIDPTTIHLYDSAAAPLGAPDVTLVGARVGAVAGSIVFDADLKGFTFIATGGPLAADNYTLKLLSGTLAFHDTIGALDGAGTGVPGSANATATFAKAANAGATISLPDFVRAPGQSVDYAVGGHGVPLTLTNATGLTSLGFHIDYNPALLTITGIIASSVPAGMTLTVNVTIPGHAVFLLSSAHPLGAGALSVGAFTASVPSSAVYGTRQILRLGVDSVAGGSAVADNALEVVGLLGDTNGNGKYDAQDALLVQRVIVKADSGFSAWPDVDPVILADVARHGSLVTIDATRIAQEAVTHARPEFPIPPTTPYAADPKVLQSGLSPTIMAAANLAPESLAPESLASANLATPLLTDGVMLGDGTDPTQMGIQADPMRIKLAKRFSDFSLSGAAGNAAWKGDFLTTIGHSSANAIASIRLTI